MEDRKNARASPGCLAQSDELNQIVSSFPDGVEHAVGYGSGVFAQTALAVPQSNEGSTDEEAIEEVESKEPPMIDLLLSVNDSRSFHTSNLRIFPDHYSSLCRLLGPSQVTAIQRSDWGARIYFNPLVDSPAGGRKIKYGVIQTEDLIEDLTEWRWLYAAGRMHKPTASLEGYIDERVLEAQEVNLDMALSASLLLLSGDCGATAHNLGDANPGDMGDPYSSFGLSKVFEIISGISYAGDPRMDVGGEDPDKVAKLVRSPGQMARFWDLYRPHLLRMEQAGLITVGMSGNTRAHKGYIEFNPSDSAFQTELLGHLPKRLRTRSSSDAQTSMKLCRMMSDIVRPAARYQSFKGLLTAGIVRSARYASAKFAKGALRGSFQ